MRQIALLSAALLLAACSSPASYDDYSPDPVELEFAAQTANSGNYFEIPEVTVTGGVGEILVEGRLAAPSPCQRLQGSAEGLAGAIEMVVRIDPVGPACVASIGNFTYTARATKLAPGTYTLRLHHRYTGAWTVPAQDFQVTVR